MAGYPYPYPGPFGMQPKDALLTEGESRPIPHTECPITPAPAHDWRGRELRVEWLIANLTPGEKAKLYKTLHDGENLRLDRCNDVIRKEKASLEKAAKKEVWP